MGGGCNRILNRETIIAGAKCDHNCFSKYGGCNASAGIATKQQETCEFYSKSHDLMLMSLDDINYQIDNITKNGKSVFLYTPDIFSNYYFESLYKKLPNRNGQTYISVNAGVQSLVRLNPSFEEIKKKGIREIWIGVESASPQLRNKYGKPKFKNIDLMRISLKAKMNDINICWYLVDGKEDTPETKLATYELIKKCHPFRINIEQLQ